MQAHCTQNTDRECRNEDCCLKKTKCEKCDDHGSYIVHGVIDEPLEIDCECKIDDIHRELVIKDNLVVGLK